MRRDMFSDYKNVRHMNYDVHSAGTMTVKKTRSRAGA